MNLLKGKLKLASGCTEYHHVIDATHSCPAVWCLTASIFNLFVVGSIFIVCTMPFPETRYTLLNANNYIENNTENT